LVDIKVVLSQFVTVTRVL